MSRLIIGVDVSQARLDVALARPGTAPDWLGGFPNDPAGWATLVQQLTASAPPDLPWRWVMEPTGGYEQPLAHFAHQQGWEVALPNPRHVRDWARSQGRRSKTDRQDALLLAAYGAAHPDLPRWQPLATAVSELEALLDRRADLQQLLQQERNRRHAYRLRPHLPAAVLDSLDQTLAALEGTLADLEAAIAHHQQTHDDLHAQARQLQTVPGIGERTALPLLTLLHRWQTLTEGQGDSKGLSAYVGLDPPTARVGGNGRRPPPSPARATRGCGAPCTWPPWAGCGATTHCASSISTCWTAARPRRWR